MKEEHVVLLVILCGSLAFLGVLIFQYLMVIAIICVVIIILLLSEFRKWVESLVEKIAAARRKDLDEAVASLREDLARIERRLDDRQEQRNDRQTIPDNTGTDSVIVPEK